MTDKLQQIKELEEVRNRQIESHQAQLKKLDSQKEELRNNLLHDLGLKSGDIVTLKLYEHRNDSIHCFQAAQECELMISRIYIQQAWDNMERKFSYENAFLCPVLHAPKRSGKKGEYKKRPVYFNEFLHWELYKDGKLILEHNAEQIIYEDMYTEEELAHWRKMYLKAQNLLNQ